MLQKIIIPAIISKTQAELDVAINKVQNFVNLLQLDIMDNSFVPNNSNDFELNLPKGPEYEAHLMINNPIKWVENQGNSIKTILVHFESCSELSEIFRLGKDNSKNVGLAINPDTSIKEVAHLLDDIYQLLILTVNPGFYGSEFLPETIEKVREARELCPNLNIEVDGGITHETILKAYEAGANMFVSGSYIMKSDQPKQAIQTLKDDVGAI